jgi:cephalosporin hydroxylase
MTNRRDPGPLAETDIPFGLLMKIQMGTMANTYKGVSMLKNPFDLALYGRLLWEAKPATILEIGSNAGGSALWFADQCQMMGLQTQIHSIDIVPVEAITHPDVTFVTGDARQINRIWTSDWIETLPRPLLVIEDADHHAITTRAALDHFGALMRPGEWLVVEDGILSAMKVDHLPEYGGGPVVALEAFLASPAGQRFIVDRGYCDFFGTNVTWNTGGFLRCVG